MPSYKLSNGEMVEKSIIDRKVRETKALLLKLQYDEHGYNFCQEVTDGKVCGRSGGTYLDCSHIKSVDWCQKNGCVEFSWDINNFKILCREHHQIHDKLNLQFKK